MSSKPIAEGVEQNTNLVTVALPQDKQPGPTARPSQPPSVRSSEQAPENLPFGWAYCVHPNGLPYYRDVARRITTSIHPPHFVHNDIEHRKDLEYIINNGAANKWELVAFVTCRRDEACTTACRIRYCVIDHESYRMLSTDDAKKKLEERQTSGLQLDDLGDERQVEVEPVLIETERRLVQLERYWAHVAQYPDITTPLHNDDVTQAYETLMYCYADRSLFKRSNAIWSLEGTKELLAIHDKLRDTRGPLWTWFIASVLRASINDRIWSRWGDPTAANVLREREHDDSIDIAPTERHLRSITGPAAALLYYLGGFLFLGVPKSYLRRIAAVYRTEGVNTVRWRAFISSLVSEWRDSNLLGTVLIAATVSILAAPSISDVPRTLSLISILFAIACVLLGVFFLWFHQPYSRSAGDLGLRYFQNAGGTRATLSLAFALSTPVVLLAWSFICFIVAIASYAIGPFEDTAQTPSSTSWVWMPVASFLFVTLLICLIAWASLPHNFAIRSEAKGIASEEVDCPCCDTPPPEDRNLGSRIRKIFRATVRGHPNMDDQPSATGSTGPRADAENGNSAKLSSDKPSNILLDDHASPPKVAPPNNPPLQLEREEGHIHPEFPHRTPPMQPIPDNMIWHRPRASPEHRGSHNTPTIVARAATPQPPELSNHGMQTLGYGLSSSYPGADSGRRWSLGNQERAHIGLHQVLQPLHPQASFRPHESPQQIPGLVADPGAPPPAFLQAQYGPGRGVLQEGMQHEVGHTHRYTSDTIDDDSVAAITYSAPASLAASRMLPAGVTHPLDPQMQPRDIALEALITTVYHGLLAYRNQSSAIQS